LKDKINKVCNTSDSVTI